MAYQPPIVWQRQPIRLQKRPIVAVASIYLVMAVCYSIGYGQTISLMAGTSFQAHKIIAEQDFSQISGMNGALAPLIELGVNDAIRFEPKSALFGVFSGLWTSGDQVMVARQNASLVQNGPARTGLTSDDLKAMAAAKGIPNTASVRRQENLLFQRLLRSRLE